MMKHMFGGACALLMGGAFVSAALLFGAGITKLFLLSLGFLSALSGFSGLVYALLSVGRKPS